MPCVEIREQKGSGVSVATSTNRDIMTELGDPPSAGTTSRLLLALTALYVQRPTHTVEEQRQYVELALHLVDKVDAATRTAVAGILQPHPDAPAEVFGRLGNMQFSTDDNPEGDPHSSEFGEAFFAASPAERRRLLSLIAVCGDDHVQTASEDGERIYEELDVAALRGRIGEFTRIFERLVDIPKRLCERILNDPSGEPMVVAAKATGMPIAMLQRILLLVSPAVSHSVQRVYDLTELYHGLDRGVARDLLALWRAQAPPDDPTPQTGPAAIDRNPGALRDISVASLRSRFGALTERLQSRAVNARPGPESVARRGLRSR